MFFKQLSEIAPNIKLTMHMLYKDGIYTLSIHPDGVQSVQGLNATGTPEELDEGLIKAITRPLTDTKSILTNTERYIADLTSSTKKQMDEAEIKSKQPNKSAKRTGTNSPGKHPNKTAKPKPTAQPNEEDEQEEEDEKEKVPEQPKKAAKQVKEPTSDPGVSDLERLMQGS